MVFFIIIIIIIYIIFFIIITEKEETVLKSTIFAKLNMTEKERYYNGDSQENDDTEKIAKSDNKEVIKM